MMKTKLLFTEKFCLGLFLLCLAISFNAQNLVSYSFNRNLNPDTAPAPGLNPTLRYYDPPNSSPINPTNFAYGYLNFANSGDYVNFDFDATNYDGLTVQFTGGIGVFFAIANGNIKAYLKIGANAEAEIANKDFSAIFIDIDTFNFSLQIPTADRQANVRIRIVGTSSSYGFFTFFGIDNLALVRNTTTIDVRSPGFAVISFNSTASPAINTDFGNLLTNEESATKTYRITNTGTRTLTIKNINLLPSNQGFSITGTLPTTINVGQSGTFNIRFSPNDQGVKSATVNINANIVPENPFIFEVKGSGKSCNLTPVPISTYGFEGSVPINMPIAQLVGNPKYIGNTAETPIPNNFGRLFYENSNNSTNLFSNGSSPNSLYARGTDTNTITLEFGPIDVSGQQETSINFDLAAFGLSANNSGVSNNANITLSVYDAETNTFIPEMRLAGSNNNVRRKYAYGAAAWSAIMDGTLKQRSNNNSANVGKISLAIPPSTLLSELRFTITANTADNNSLWLIDNIHVDAGNAKYKMWNGSAWIGETPGRPGSREKAIFDGNYDFSLNNETGNLSVCECEVSAGKNLVVPADKALIVRNKLVNYGTANNVVLNSDASLIQTEDGAINIGSITVKRNLTFRNSDRKEYNYLISPVVDANLRTDIYKKSDGTAVSAPEVLYYNEANYKFFSSTGAYIKGRALAVKEPPVSSGAVQTAFFSGRPFNGILSYPLAYSGADFGYNLVGNPYPSNLDLDILYEDNQTEIQSTFMFWDNTVNEIYVQQGSAYDGSAYAIYNAAAGSAGTGLPAPGSGQAAVRSSKIPNRIVKTGQGFMVRSLGIGKVLQYGNHQRLADNTDAVFFGKNKPDDRYYLSLNSPTGITSTLAVVYFEGGNNGFAADDSEARGSSDEIYSFAGDTRLIINGRSAFSDTEVLPLGTRGFSAGNYTVSLSLKEGVFAEGQKIYLKDKKTGVITDLTLSDYTYTSANGEHTDRFEIVYKPAGILATDREVYDDISVYRDGSDFVVKAKTEKISQLEIYDGVGRLIYKEQPDKLEVRLADVHLVHGAYILRLNQNGKVSTRKILK